jgi:replicative DNA helicase
MSRSEERPVSRVDRLPPFSEEAEQGVIGCCLLDSASVQMVLERIPDGAQAFYDMRHRTLFEVMVVMVSDKRPVDMITLGNELRSLGHLEALGGLSYLSQLMDVVPSVANLTYYIEDLADLYQRRQVLRYAMELSAEVFEPGRVGAHLISMATERIGQLVASTKTPGHVPVKQTLTEIVDEIEAFSQGRKQMRGITSGLNYLDNMTCGWKAEEFIVVAGRPGGGKTALAMQFVEAACVHQKVPVGMFSLEMSQKVLMQRLLFSMAGVNFQRYRNGFLKNTDMRLLTKAMNVLKDVPLYIDDDATLYCEDLEIRARKMVREQGVRMIVIDYLQLISGRRQANYRGENMVMQMNDVSSTILRLKKELKIPFIVLAQENTNREKADRTRKPLLSDLKDSQKPAQDADAVMFLCDVDLSKARRDLGSKDEAKAELAKAEFSWKDSKSVRELPAEIREDDEANLKRVNLYIAKQRNGPTGDCALVMVKPWMRFVDAYTEGASTVAQSDEGEAEFPEVAS